jgi:tRNA (guanosine-2'-O-)-methyltransferase
MTPERERRLEENIRKTQTNLCVVLENVRDKHNVGAVMRSCDAVGVRDLHLIHTMRALKKESVLHGFRAASAAQQWVNIHVWHSVEACFLRLRQIYPHIYATHLSTDSKSLYELDLVQPTALVFGNEQKGISKETLEHCTGNFTIPMHGFTQSLNISVACAVSLYEAQRQRHLVGCYTDQPVIQESEKVALHNLWTQPRIKKAPEVPKVWPVKRKSTL